MRRVLFSTLILCLSLLACSALTPAASPATSLPAPASTEVVPASTPEPTFPVSVYRDASVGFQMDYPEGWMVESFVIGPRGSQGQLASWQHRPGDIETGRPEGSTLVTATSYRWDPQENLSAYAEHRVTAWDASGFAVQTEGTVTLPDGRPAMTYLVRTPDTLTFFLFAAYGSYYVEVAGDGDLNLVRHLALTLRPLTAP